MSNSDLDRMSHGPMSTAVDIGDGAITSSTATTTTATVKNRAAGAESGLNEKSAPVVDDADEESISSGPHKAYYDHTHRRLKPRHVQLIGIGGTIGTILYVQIGEDLGKGGPASLFMAFSIW